MLIWQYHLRSIFAFSEKVCWVFPSYLKEGGKGPVLRMVGYWSQEVLNVRWDYALREVGEVGGMGGGHQKHLHLHWKKGQYQQQNFSNQDTVSGKNNDFLLLLINNFTCSVYPASSSLTLLMGADYFLGGVWRETQTHKHTCMHTDFFDLSALSIKKQYFRLWNSLLFTCNLYNIKTLEVWTKYITDHIIKTEFLCNNKSSQPLIRKSHYAQKFNVTE